VTRGFDLVIVGAQKSGTTSLHRYLCQHPRVVGHDSTEFAFFASNDEFERGWEHALVHYLGRVDPAPGDHRLVAKSASIYSSDVFVDRLAEFSPGARVVLLLRDPVQRAFSAHQMEAAKSGPREPFEHLREVGSDPQHPWTKRFLGLGLYADALERIERRVPADKFDVFFFEEFVTDPAPVCHHLFTSLGLEPHRARFEVHNGASTPRSAAVARVLTTLRDPNSRVKQAAKRALAPAHFNRLAQTAVHLNQGRPSHAEMSAEMEAWLAAYYEEPNRRLSARLGRPLPNWTTARS